MKSLGSDKEDCKLVVEEGNILGPSLWWVISIKYLRDEYMKTLANNGKVRFEGTFNPCDWGGPKLKIIRRTISTQLLS